MNTAAFDADGDDRAAVRRDQEGAEPRAPTAPTSRRTRSTSSKREGVDVNGSDWKKATRQGHAGRQVDVRCSRAAVTGGLESSTPSERRAAMSVLIKGGRVITAADDYVARRLRRGRDGSR